MMNNPIFSWITRHSFLIALLALAFYFVGVSNVANQQLLAFLCALEAVAILFSAFGNWVYTRVRFETANPIVSGIIYLSCHLLVAIASGPYFLAIKDNLSTP